MRYFTSYLKKSNIITYLTLLVMHYPQHCLKVVNDLKLNTVDHCSSINGLETRIGLSGNVLKWFRTCITARFSEYR